MRFTVAAAIALSAAVAATTASAGVVISENVVTSNRAGTQKGEETVMVQGTRQKVNTGDRTFITDLDTGRLYLLMPAEKGYAELPFPPTGVVLGMMAREGVSVELKKAGGTHKVAGYDCQDYAGSQRLGHYNVEVAECVAGAAAGVPEFVAFSKARAAKLKDSPLEFKGEIPDGIPVSSTVTATLIPFPIPRNFPPDMAAKVKEADAKIKPEVKRTTVTKIEVKHIAAKEFEVPAEYRKPVIKPTMKSGVPGGPNPPVPVPPGELPPSKPATH
ncbi:MAG: hypothetical protein ACREQH_07790 [Candidatus Binatus sp.]